MKELKRVLTTSLEEKNVPGQKASQTRLVVFAFALAWVVRFLTPPIVEMAAMALVGMGLMQPDQVPMTQPLGQAMAWLGAVIVLAMPLKSFMDRVSVDDLPAIIGQVFGGVWSGGLTSTPTGGQSWTRAKHSPEYQPPEDFVTDGERDEEEGDEP